MSEILELIEAARDLGAEVRRLDAIAPGAVLAAGMALADPHATAEALDDTIAATTGALAVYDAAIDAVESAAERLEVALASTPATFPPEHRAALKAQIANARGLASERRVARIGDVRGE